MTKSNSETKLQAQTVSRDFKKREIEAEAALLGEHPVLLVSEVEKPTDRRTFFRAVIPATGKLLTVFLREVGTAISIKSD